MLRDFLYFHRADRRAIILLALLAVFCCGVLLVRHARHEPVPTAGMSPQGTADSSRTQGHNPAGSRPSGYTGSTSGTRIALRPFDPNTVDSATLAGFGIRPWKVRNLIHYRRAGKQFRSADDLLDTYGWNESDVAPLRPFIHIGETYRQPARSAGRAYADRQPVRSDSMPPSRGSNKFRELTLVDPNTADTALLQRIPGIGHYFALSIVRLRERFGGLTDIGQLLEINHFPEETLEWFRIEHPQLRTIRLATADFGTLARHPYIGYQHARAIANYQRLYGPITSLDALRGTHILSDDDIERLAPYLEFP